MQPQLYNSIANPESASTSAPRALLQPTEPKVIDAHPDSLLHRCLKRFGGKTIFVYGKRYLTRYYLLGNGSGDSYEIYVHHMHAADGFRWLHNHPWKWFFSFVFSGYYFQNLYDRKTNRYKRSKIRWFNLFRGLDRYHAIRELPKGDAWTLVIAPPKLKDYQWGYWDDENKVHIEDDHIGHESAHDEIFGNKTLKD